jgi:hypothetical protein
MNNKLNLEIKKKNENLSNIYEKIQEIKIMNKIE